MIQAYTLTEKQEKCCMAEIKLLFKIMKNVLSIFC